MDNEEEATKLQWPDVLVIAAYFLIVLAVGVWASRRSQRNTASGYFLASRNMSWIPVGASIFASNIGSGHFIGLAGAGAASGIAVGGYEQGASYLLVALGWLFVPVYLSSGVYTMPDYLKQRFGGDRISVYMSCLSLALAVFTKISADLYAGALFMQMSLNKSSEEWLYISILILLGIAALFTVAGGLTAVVWTDLVQTVLMVLGALVLMVKAMSAVGGYAGLVDNYPYATASERARNHLNESCGEPPSDFMHLLRTLEPGKSNYPWIGMTLGLGILELWYWCMDQVMVQRTLASRNVVHAKGGCLLAAYLKFLPMFLIVFPGMAARILYPNRVACASPETCTRICGSARGCFNIAYIELVLNLLPVGVRGLMLAVMMAALMSSLTSVFNSASTIFTMDIWLHLRRMCRRRGREGGMFSAPPSDVELVVVARIFVTAMVGISVVWIPVIQNNATSELFDYINTINSFLAPPICAVYLSALFWNRTTETGAFWGLMFGLAVGVFRFALEFTYAPPPCGLDADYVEPAIITTFLRRLHYLHFCCLLFFLTILVIFCVSLTTSPRPKDCLYRLTFWSRHDPRVRNIVKGDDDQIGQETAGDQTSSTGTQTPGEFETDEKPCWQRVLCGGPAKSKENTEAPPVLDEEEQAKEAVKVIDEPPFWKRMLDINAVTCLALCTFVYGYYA
ncbi:sodium/glucose cotransporter 5-like [Penaeus chinensis]|uniref:sodium/glucose cotransporter 5-like n=1 Tax=Penaeus chinensis TaxID=139456 RepID=UPI001FB74616|nr:sodium/glucose cotransporter 5-like [Penaeus chinensis]